MLHFRLIYEQLEAAKAHTLSGSILGCRLGLILLDNVAELLMHRELGLWFSLEDDFKPMTEPAYSNWLRDGLGPKYTHEERAAAQREFEPKTRILGHRLRLLSADESLVLNTCHKIRCEAFHQGRLRPGVLEIVTKLLYLTVIELTTRLSSPPVVLTGGRASEEEGAFMARFGVDDPFILPTEKGKRLLADHLRCDIGLDAAAVAASLSQDLLERIDDTLGGLSTLSRTGRPEGIDGDLQYSQFWKEVGVRLAKSRVRQPQLDRAYERWKAEGRARYTLHRIHKWRRQATAIARGKSAVRALSHYWGIDRRLRPLEDEVSDAVAHHDDWADAHID